MKLEKLLDRVPCEKINYQNIDIDSISIDSRKTVPNSLFIAWKGVNIDSHLFIESAIQQGASAIVAEKEAKIPLEIPFIKVEDGREAYSLIAQNYYNKPANNIDLIGVTGTTGKTTIAFLIYALLNDLGIKTGLIGTSGYYSGTTQINALLKGPVTTPEPMELNDLFSKMFKDNCHAVVMEASSFGLEQKRLFGLSFRQTILSNLSYNHHINYHHGMRGYIAAKEQLFKQLKTDGIGIINMDTEYSDDFHVPTQKIKTVGTQEGADYRIQDFYQSRECGISFSLQTEDVFYKITSPLSGFHQAYNLSEAFISLLHFGFEPKKIISSISRIESIPGRWHFIKSSLPFSVLIDKANTPIAIKSIIPLLESQHYANHILVFGNVGGGDSLERRMMAKLFYDSFHTIIVTTDDPEDEDPMAGIIDFLNGIPGFDSSRVIIELERKKAIQIALKKAKENDLVAILGRGNQREFLEKGKTREFDDIVVTDSLLREMEKNSETSS
jgi:UDP-N-acetylmuramoyl-L-alanyl-D-glutamate--2,6-diaminopimelate ligase